ncbi:MAG: hypothetical protein Q8N91_03105, partial [Candidatus Omnitrophota bacterium]|nr:hypothetical protein [Candidatus Omnitrophota bacterium]
MTKQSKDNLATTDFTIPQYLGTIRDCWQSQTSTLRRGQRLSKGLAQGEYGSLPSVVIHIQDAHCN